MANQNGSATLYAVAIGGILFGIVVANLGKGTSHANLSHSDTPAKPTTISEETRLARRIASSLSEIPLQTPKPLKTARAKDGSLIEHPESYTPKTVTLLKPVLMNRKINGKYAGTHTVPPGTEVNVRAVIQGDVMIEYEGSLEKVPAADTDLLDQMVSAVSG